MLDRKDTGHGTHDTGHGRGLSSLGHNGNLAKLSGSLWRKLFGRHTIDSLYLGSLKLKPLKTARRVLTVSPKFYFQCANAMDMPGDVDSTWSFTSYPAGSPEECATTASTTPLDDTATTAAKDTTGMPTSRQIIAKSASVSARTISF